MCLTFGRSSPQAQAILADVTDGPTARPAPKAMARIEVLALSLASRVLRRHCGVGGVALAALLGQAQGQAQGRDGWIVSVGEEALRASPLRGEECPWECPWGYDQLGEEAMPYLDAVGGPRVAAARDRGVLDPVLLVLPPDCPQAVAVHAAVRGTAEPNADDDYIAVVSTADACRLLRLHAGLGGAAVTDLLQDRRPVEAYWAVVLGKDAIEAAPLSEGQIPIYYSIAYDHPPRRLLTPSRMMEEGPSAIPLQLDSGEVAQVYGRSGEAALMAGYLVEVVTGRRVECEVEGRVRSVALTDHLLADMLLDLVESFGRDGSPHIISEAITALRKVGRGKDRRLLRVLWGRGELRQLAKEVQRELTGR